MKITRATHLSLLQHQTYLELCSEQNKEAFDPLEEPKGDPSEGKPPSQPKNEPSTEPKEEPRIRRDGCDGRKLNLFSLIHENDTTTQHCLKQIAIRLIEILYGSCSFYEKDAASTIVHKMMKAKIHSLEELKFDDMQLDQIYYKMLQGTSTGYPPLGEYVYLEDKRAPILFQYAKRPLIQAAVGDTCAATIFDLEKQRYQQDHHNQALLKETFLALMKDNHASLIPHNLIDTIFNFKKAKKGSPQIQQTGKISTAHRPAK